MTKILRIDYDGDTCVDAKLVDPIRFLRVPFGAGEPIDDQFPKDSAVVIDSAGSLTDYFEAGPMDVVSARLKGILDLFGVGAEYLEISVKCESGSGPSESYYCFNPIEQLDRFDRELSRFNTRGDFFIDIERLVLLSPPAPEPSLYVLARTIPTIICVRDDLARRIEIEECAGVRFWRPDEWRNPNYPC